MTTAARACVDLLAQAGVRRFYTVPGESFLELMDEVDRHPELTLVSTRHESAAAFMAEAEAKMTGRPAVAMATRAVGAANLAIGVHTAHQDSTPMLVLLGQVETDHLGKEAFQEVDLPRFYDQITTYATTVHRADRVAETVADALRAATTGRPGPAMVALPADVLGAPARPAAPRLRRRPRPTPSGAEVTAVSTALTAARQPVVVLGEGAADLHEPLVRFAEHYGLGVYTAFRRQDAFPNDHGHYLGHLTLGTSEEVLAPLREADLVLVLGSRLDEVTTQGYTLPASDQSVIQVDEDPDTLGAVVRLQHGVQATVGSFVAALLDRPTEAWTSARTDWTAAHAAYERFSDPSGHHEHHGGGGVHPAAVMEALRRAVPADAVLTNDAGNFSVFGHRYWRFTHPRSQVGPASGAMGYAVPAAVGVGLAVPDRTVVALAGDGGFLMTGQEIETAVRYGVDMLVVVFQNQMYGTIAMHQARSLGRTAGTDIGPADLAAYARALGAAAVTVDAATDLDSAFDKVSMHPGPRVVVVRTDPDVLTPTAQLSRLLERSA